ncbi:MAG: chromosome segregation protein SMC [Firmicutes bacterium]|nr:chromosome segregation protein SMC [Bacillota bacterium]
MRLKRLELQGFKSFARPVCLQFEPGITAIVGPNGSGKSNIYDAIRWVLGEQSAKSLRGQKMEDVIFAGSDGKKPLGMAQVELTLDNSAGFLPLDYSEVTVTRRVFRSGDSEFLINKQNCRLKDIHNLFTDTGLGREGYALIGQGQIEAVLSVRSEDRRILLEETAGIVKYRQRKEEALKKLEDTSVDLLRVTDILQELQKQLKPLGRQAEIARRYLDLAQQLTETELDCYHLAWRHLEEKQKQGIAAFRQAKQEFEKADSLRLAWEEKKKGLEALISQGEAELEERQELQFQLAEEYNSGLNIIQLNQERLKNNDVRRRELERVLAEKDKELKAARAESARLEAQLDQVAQLLSWGEKDIRAREKNLEELRRQYKEGQEQIDNLKNEFFEFMRELSESRNYRRDFNQRREMLERQIFALEKENKEISGKIKELLPLQTAAEEGAQAEKAGLAQGRERQAELKQKMETTWELLEQNRKETRRLEANQAQLEARLRTLEELEIGYEGYGQGVRRIMQKEELRPLILGTVAEVIKVPRGLETAFEVALGPALQNIITASEKEAKALIKWLQSAQAGRVTFLPLASMKGRGFPAAARKLLDRPGVLGTGAQLLQFEEKYDAVLKSLLGRVVITEDIEVALDLRKRLFQFTKIVTRDGSLLFPGGAMTGGSLNKAYGLLNRKAEISKLKKDLTVLEDQIRTKRRTRTGLESKFAEDQRLLAQLEESLVSNRLKLESLNQKGIQIQRELAHWKAVLEENEKKKRESQAVFNSLEAEEEEAATTVLELESREDTFRQTISEAEASSLALNGKLKQREQELTAAQIKQAELKGQWENIRTKIQNQARREADGKRDYEKACSEQKTLAAEQVNFHQVISRTEQANLSRKQKRADLEEQIKQLRQKHQEAKRDLVDVNEHLIQNQKEQSQKERLLYKWETELEHLKLERQRILESLNERGVLLAAVVNRSVTRQKEALKTARDKLRRRIRALGSVNPGAADEYERVKSRCSFLEAQLTDLNKARQSLQDVINKMDKLCRVQLRETFHKVQVEFQKLFQKLFSGGKANLILTDSESILTSGIDILAQPPGKKLQNLLLFSGGERALTAIALLFAIRRVKPTPFCVLDEIDATLDDHNLVRFTRLMEEFTENTQFVVITHRPGTMEVAHSLYGVTMGPDAVSQIVSVALK